MFFGIFAVWKFKKDSFMWELQSEFAANALNYVSLSLLSLTKDLFRVLQILDRNSRPEVFCKKAFIKI